MFCIIDVNDLKESKMTPTFLTQRNARAQVLFSSALGENDGRRLCNLELSLGHAECSLL